MINIYIQKPGSPAQIYEARSSIVSYGALAAAIGYDSMHDVPTLSVSIDGGRTMLVTAADEMTVVEDMHVEIKW